MTTTLARPSALLPDGLRIEQVNHLLLFKFSEDLGNRMQALLDKQKLDALSPEEATELEAIRELDDIFSYINAAIAAQGHAHL